MQQLKKKSLPRINNHITDKTLKVIPPPKRRGILILRFLIALGFGSMMYFTWWFFSANHIGFAPLYWLLIVAFGFRFLKLLHEWYHYWAISVPERPVSRRDWKVDMITTFVPGEPYDMIVETLEAMVAVNYPHKTYLCDEGNDPFLIEKCKELGVIHSYRGPDKKNAKAGNVNYCLENHADGEIVVILDPDHVPSPDFLDRVLPYFKDEELGYVQCIQAYYNRNESFIAKGAAEQTYHFYGPMMMSMNSYGTAQAIGANCTFRRKALDSIGGHKPGLSEDMHTAMQLHAAGWESIYVPEALTRGQVPETLSGYYKQQLKWSRGSFDLLVNVVPKIARNLTWRQIIHYVTIPLFFLSGLVGLIDITVPIVSLFTAQSPWKVQMVELGKAALPLFIMIMTIRQYVQRYVLEEHERGFHFMGGALLFATWWVHLTGLIYTFLNIKVPYIPTPKGDEKIDEWRISLPNLGVILLSIAAIAYGLSIDWSPYSMIMAFYASVNIFMLGFVLIVSQQKSMGRFYGVLYSGRGLVSGIRSFWYKLRHNIVYPAFRNTGIALLMIGGVFWGAFTFLKVEKGLDISREAALNISSNSPFYIATVNANEAASVNSFKIQVLDEKVDTSSLALQNMLLGLDSMGSGNSPCLSLLLDTTLDESGKKRYWKHFANNIKSHRNAVLIRPYLKNGNPIQKDHWVEMVNTVREEGAWNAVWIWDCKDSMRSYPGDKWVDYCSFDRKLFDTFKEDIQKPSFISGNFDEDWFFEEEDFTTWKAKNPLVHGLLLDESSILNTNWFESIEKLNAELWGEEWTAEKSRAQIRKWLALHKDDLVKSYGKFKDIKRVSINQNGGGNQLLINGESAYVKGVAYNPSHDWRDGFTPLTRIKLEEDFGRIKGMGANTIRRYAPGWYDTNILRTADVEGIHVIYGFWFSPDIDYARDSIQVKGKINEVVRNYRSFGGHSSIMSWGIGNETFYRLGNFFPPLRLVEARASYLILIDEICKMLKELGDERLIMTGVAHHSELEGALAAYQTFSPSVDLYGINAHYSAQLAEVSSIMEDFAQQKPFMISEFSLGGYWDQTFTEKDPNGKIEEPSDFQKAQKYSYNWKEYIEKYKGSNVGGIAYCWQDRIEGTGSWFGLTSLEGDLKPSYYALKEAWTGEEANFPLADVQLIVPPARPGVMPYLPFRVISSNNSKGGLRYNWRVINDETQEELKNVERIDKWNLIQVPLPIDTGSYRVYLTITDKNGHAVEASRGFNFPYP
ncbi:MAG: glycosyltransferase [Bacteroidia bacterium]|nr:glycosyltransferase [Bacteroidia bacterium]